MDAVKVERRIEYNKITIAFSGISSEKRGHAMDGTTSDFSALSAEQLAMLNEKQKAIFQMLSSNDQSFFASTFTHKDLPGALDRKGEIMQRDQEQREQLAALQEKYAKIDTDLNLNQSGSLDLGDLAAGAAAALGLGVAAGTIATQGSASYHGVPPRTVARALESNFGKTQTTDVEVDGEENNLLATIYLKSPDNYVPALTVALVQAADTLEVKVSDLTSESLLEAAKEGGKKLLNLAGKGLQFWLRRKQASVGEAVDVAQSALNTVFDATQTAKDLKLQDRVWQVIKETAEVREKAYLVEEERARQERQDLIDAWDDYNNCPQCGIAYPPDAIQCKVCGRARNNPPSQPDPRNI